MPPDEELNAYILTRLKILGIDLSVLPADDASAPADQKRILDSARRVLQNTVPTVSGYAVQGENVPPILYPAALASVWEREE
jgi:hypothetical protein